jgi:putative ABC transport system ATP-binding protein
MPAAVPPVLRTEGVWKGFFSGSQRREVLRGIDFQIRPGELVFLSGPSGSGKSTLLAILGCLLTPDRGRLWINGRDADRLTIAERAEIRRRDIGFVFQRFQLIQGLSALDNVALPLGLLGHSPSDARRRAADLLTQLGLGDHCQLRPTQLSPGQCQRVALGRAVIAKPSILLADEPTAALDAVNGREIMNLLRDCVKRTNVAAVIVTHDPRIEAFADRICRLEDGIIVP